jgi:hypothetical protein
MEYLVVIWLVSAGIYQGSTNTVMKPENLAKFGPLDFETCLNVSQAIEKAGNGLIAAGCTPNIDIKETMK